MSLCDDVFSGAAGTTVTERNKAMSASLLQVPVLIDKVCCSLVNVRTGHDVPFVLPLFGTYVAVVHFVDLPCALWFTMTAAATATVGCDAS